MTFCYFRTMKITLWKQFSTSQSSTAEIYNSPKQDIENYTESNTEDQKLCYNRGSLKCPRRWSKTQMKEKGSFHWEKKLLNKVKSRGKEVWRLWSWATTQLTLWFIHTIFLIRSHNESLLHERFWYLMAAQEEFPCHFSFVLGKPPF